MEKRYVKSCTTLGDTYLNRIKSYLNLYDLDMGTIYSRFSTKQIFKVYSLHVQ